MWALFSDTLQEALLEEIELILDSVDNKSVSLLNLLCKFNNYYGSVSLFNSISTFES